jgi:hypothetical protein
MVGWLIGKNLEGTGRSLLKVLPRIWWEGMNKTIKNQDMSRALPLYQPVSVTVGFSAVFMNSFHNTFFPMLWKFFVTPYLCVSYCLIVSFNQPGLSLLIYTFPAFQQQSQPHSNTDQFLTTQLYISLPNTVNSICFQQLREVILPSRENNVWICKQITMPICY